MKLFSLALAFLGAAVVSADTTTLNEPCLASVLTGKAPSGPPTKHLRNTHKKHKIDIQFELMCKTPSGMYYKIDAPNSWIRAKMESGELVGEHTILQIPFGTPIVDDVIQLETLPLQLANPDGPSRKRRLQTSTFTGDKTVLAVRVKTRNGVHSTSLNDLSDQVFGTSGTAVNMVSQYQACSHNQLNFGPTTDRSGTNINIANGVVEIEVDIRTGSKSNGCAPRQALTNAITAKINEEFGVTSPSQLADHVMYCMPPGAMDGGCADTPGWLSWYDDELCEAITFSVHEIGHNLGSNHASEGSEEYGDNTDMMGGPQGDQQVCFNGAKAWRFGWFSNRHLVINRSNTEYQGTLGSVVEDPNNGNHPIIVQLDTTGTEDYYVTFNAVTGPARGVDEAINQVTVVRQDSEGNDQFTSFLVAKLGVGNTYSISNFDGTGQSLTVRVNSIATLTADVSICVGACGSSPTPAPANPTTPATPAPVSPTAPPATCVDYPNWRDSEDDDCAGYASNNWCGDYGDWVGTDGQTANQACCTCGGGSKGPTPAPVTPPTEAPVAPPTDAPVTPPTDAPVTPPTDAPVTPPTDAPVTPPTEAPVTPPTDAPVTPPATCVDYPNWIDTVNDSCDDYETNDWCGEYGDWTGTDGRTANQACCACGGGSNGPTPAPVTPPTEAPITPPTEAPVTPPTDAPVNPPTDAPVTPPTDAPVNPPTDAPVTPPTEAPVTPPTDAPVTPPTDAPVTPPTDAPVTPPTDAPVTPPTEAPVTPPTDAPVTPTCVDYPNWIDTVNDSCDDYATNNWCGEYGDWTGTDGRTANQACCACGGGTTGSSPTAAPVTPPTEAPAVCVDYPNWIDSEDDDCAGYASNNWCADYGDWVGTDGRTANQACCACGGGSNSSR